MDKDKDPESQQVKLIHKLAQRLPWMAAAIIILVVLLSILQTILTKKPPHL